MKAILIPEGGQDILLEACCICKPSCRRLIGLITAEGREIIYCRVCGLAWDRYNSNNTYAVANPDAEPIIRF